MLLAAFAARNVLHMSLEKTAHLDNVAILREQLQSLQTRLSTLQGWRMRELTDEQVESISEEVRDAMRACPVHPPSLPLMLRCAGAFRDESRRRKSAAAALADGMYRCIVCTSAATRACLVRQTFPSLAPSCTHLLRCDPVCRCRAATRSSASVVARSCRNVRYVASPVRVSRVCLAQLICSFTFFEVVFLSFCLIFFPVQMFQQIYGATAAAAAAAVQHADSTDCSNVLSSESNSASTIAMTRM